jgi:hypothetical protein
MHTGKTSTSILMWAYSIVILHVAPLEYKEHTPVDSLQERKHTCLFFSLSNRLCF